MHTITVHRGDFQDSFIIYSWLIMVWRIFVTNTIPGEIGFFGEHTCSQWPFSPISEIEHFLTKCIMAISLTSTADRNCVLGMKYI